MDAITVLNSFTRPVDGFVQMNDDAVPAFLGYWGPRWSFPYTGPTAPGTEAKDVTWSAPAGQPTGTTIADWISARRKEGKMILASATPSNAALFTDDPGNVLMLIAAKPENAKLYASSHVVVFKAGGWPTWAKVALGAAVVGGVGYVVARRRGYVRNGGDDKLVAPSKASKSSRTRRTRTCGT